MADTGLAIGRGATGPGLCTLYPWHSDCTPPCMGLPECCLEEAVLGGRQATAPNRFVEAGLPCGHERACVQPACLVRCRQPVAAVLVRRNVVLTWAWAAALAFPERLFSTSRPLRVCHARATRAPCALSQQAVLMPHGGAVPVGAHILRRLLQKFSSHLCTSLGITALVILSRLVGDLRCGARRRRRRG